jgi:hypothetical protein
MSRRFGTHGLHLKQFSHRNDGGSSLLSSETSKRFSDTISYFGPCPSSNFLNARHFGSQLCFRLQAKKYLTLWTPQIELFSITAHRRNTKRVKICTCLYGAQWLRITRSEESPRLGASLPEAGSRSGLRNVVLFKNRRWSPKKKSVCQWVIYHRQTPFSVEFETFITK